MALSRHPMVSFKVCMNCGKHAGRHVRRCKRCTPVGTVGRDTWREPRCHEIEAEADRLDRMEAIINSWEEAAA